MATAPWRTPRPTHRLRDRASSVTSTRRNTHADAVQRVGRHLTGQPFLRIRKRLENRPAHRFEAGSRLFRPRRDVLTHRLDALSRPFGRHAAHIMRTPEADRRVEEVAQGNSRIPGCRIYPVGRMER